MRFNDVTRGTGLEEHGIVNANLIHWTAPTAVLYEQIVKRGEGLLTHLGAIAVKTGHYTGHAVNEKYIVDEESCRGRIDWGIDNKPFPEEKFEGLFKRMLAYMHGRDLFVQDCFAGADPEHRLPVRIITERAWHSLFSRNMFVQARGGDLERFSPAFSVIDLPNFHATPALDGTTSETFIIINFARRLITIGGTSYAGEIKKALFTVLNYLLPLDQGVLPMHCSANQGPSGDTALFFGISGSGKTTLSAAPDRRLIGDDEHGWDEKGIFTFEGGCYAKIIGLSREAEPGIYETTRRFGTILENVAIDTRSRRVNLSDASFTENTRASYPLTHIPNIVPSGTSGHPATVFLLTRDAYGVLPPISRLTAGQAAYHFLSGYSSRIVGTESGPTFSSCFGAQFMPLAPAIYAKLFRERITRHTTACWLVNTGWSGGPYGVGSRLQVQWSRALVNAALDGTLAGGAFRMDPFFGVEVPAVCPGIPAELLDPRQVWQDTDAYDYAAGNLVKLFRENFRHHAENVSEDVVSVL